MTATRCHEERTKGLTNYLPSTDENTGAASVSFPGSKPTLAASDSLSGALTDAPEAGALPNLRSSSWA